MSCRIIVTSCPSRQSLQEIWIKCRSANWSDCPYPFSIISMANDVGWNANLISVLETLDDVMKFYREQRDALDAQNYARSQFVQSRITPLAGDRALVDRTYRRYRKDGTVLLEAAAVYVVCKSSGAWKVCGLFPHDLEGFGKVY